MRINVTGGILDTTGYSSHTRNLVNSLYKVADVKLTTSLLPDWQKRVSDAEYDMITKQPNETDINIIITTPHNWKIHTGLGINCGYCVWEGSNVPKSYIDEMLNPNIDLVFVPSIHTMKSIANTALIVCKDSEIEIIKNKVKIIPHGVDLSLFYKKENQSTRPFRFVCNKGWRGTSWDRGGVQYILKAFAEEFKSKENVELLVKLNPAYINMQMLQQAVNMLNLPQDRAPIQIRLEDTPFNKLVELYNESDCFICATRSEAFNLPGLEAMACGLPTIQTNFGGQTDYMTEENSLNIDYKLEEVKEDMMYEGISWATPDITSIRKQMRWAFENQDKMKEMGNKALEDSKNWSWDNSAKKIIEELNKIK